MAECPLGPVVQPLRGMGFFCSGHMGPTLSFSVPLGPWVDLQLQKGLGGAHLLMWPMGELRLRGKLVI